MIVHRDGQLGARRVEELQGQVRMLADELANDVAEFPIQHRDIEADGEASRLSSARRIGEIENAFEVGDDSTDPSKEIRAFRRGRNTASIAGEYRDADRLFQLPNLPAHMGVMRVEPLAGANEAAFLRDDQRLTKLHELNVVEDRPHGRDPLKSGDVRSEPPRRADGTVADFA